MIKINIYLVLSLTVFLGQQVFSSGETSNSTNSQNDLEKFKKEALECHNKKREIHGVHPLSLDEELNKKAQEYAETIALKDGISTKKNTSLGQSVYSNRSPNASAESACRFIYKQNENYDYSNNPPSNFKQVGLFTQMVSKASCNIGIGMTKTRTGKLIAVFFYDPSGNFKNEYLTNVFPPKPENYTSSPLDSVMRKTVCSEVDRKTYLEQNLECHNAVRAKYNEEPLVYSEELNKYALEKIESLVENGTKHKIVGDDYSTYWISIALPKLDGYFYCQHHYNKGKKITIEEFEKRKNQGTLATDGGGFTQMIWKSTKEMGFAMAIKNRKMFSLAVYRPKGNIGGAFEENLSNNNSVVLIDK